MKNGQERRSGRTWFAAGVAVGVLAGAAVGTVATLLWLDNNADAGGDEGRTPVPVPPSVVGGATVQDGDVLIN